MSTYELNPCIERIEGWFESETIILLDRVLTDDPHDPEYSANTAYANLEEIVRFEELYRGIRYKDVTDYLLKNGYTPEDVKLLTEKRIDEDRRHSS
ncbi:MAG: hypothetical protein MJ141_02575 [Clostridia bacterium]|nr:hypothetical protein [Clostridia bacterium]